MHAKRFIYRPTGPPGTLGWSESCGQNIKIGISKSNTSQKLCTDFHIKSGKYENSMYASSTLYQAALFILCKCMNYLYKV